MLRTNNLGYPRIGNLRQLKKSNEAYWAGKISREELIAAGKGIRRENWLLQRDAGIDLIPSGDFSFYDQVLDTSLMVGAIPPRYHQLVEGKGPERELDLYFAMARGYQRDGKDITAMEMTKWFDTNYHYLVPEFTKGQQFGLFSEKVMDEFYEAKQLGIQTKPVLLGPLSFLLLGKEKEGGFHRLDLLDSLLPVYGEVLQRLKKLGAEYVQLDEPCLALDLDKRSRQAYRKAYRALAEQAAGLKLIVATYFEGLGDNANTALNLPVQALHIDLVRGEGELYQLLPKVPHDLILSLGVVDGRNIWKNDYEKSLLIIRDALNVLGKDRVWIAPSCSLLHVPCDLDLETDEKTLPPGIKDWLAFAKQKLAEVSDLGKLADGSGDTDIDARLAANRRSQQARAGSRLIHRHAVKQRVQGITEADSTRPTPFTGRKPKQQVNLGLPDFPTTTIGSFPQTGEVRSWRARLKKGELSGAEYDTLIKQEIEKTIRWQEQTGIDVPVHGEFERNDMVEYFGEQLRGYAFTGYGWVQSYGSRCVKPPILYGDVSRPEDMSVYWSSYSQSLTPRPVKGMLTGPVTMLQWSFVRNDQPRHDTLFQIALAIRDEVVALERAGIKIIQIDEPAFREGLPLRKADQQLYLDRAVQAFKLSSSGVRDETQIHTHMCYSEFNDIIGDIARMDADVITIETSRSQMELLDVFADFKYPNDIGPGVYDIHSPRIPPVEEILFLLEKAKAVIPAEQLWVNPDCGLKTRTWGEATAALENMVEAARILRSVKEKDTVEAS
ncbi:5-methyltetrahydropteroyltriglutamate--homocysteine S-methyltransferase [Parapedobacter koreensis]|uniref:5-methyltetrahydropteroyltriglutamate--homocysteine methyltransferase n=1 Tax=Parapedobacter koreensis TaxID=332977 RepID=A0A1H7IDW8_9SPHI|nr:5-methyltetrahydropteroyltriglutamate--homocysteine S-methyltransferase [Parapedobacter koreensis]SEK60648.1 methionine synthase (B12-independent) [Parapedobacter koreensis]